MKEEVLIPITGRFIDKKTGQPIVLGHKTAISCSVPKKFHIVLTRDEVGTKASHSIGSICPSCAISLYTHTDAVAVN